MTFPHTRLVAAAACIGCTLGSIAHAGESTVVSIPPSLDNTMFSNGNSSGAGLFLFSGRTGPSAGGHLQRALIQFDIASAVPAGATIESVDLRLVVQAGGPQGGTQTYTLHRVLAEWGEGTSESGGGLGAPPTVGDATWTHRFHPTHAWSNLGGDFVAAGSGSLDIPPVQGFVTFESTPGLVADVQAWLDDPESAYGWVMIGNEGVLGTARKFNSREFFKEDLRPELEITYRGGAAACPADVDGSGSVEFTDLLSVLANWGACAACPEDFDQSGSVDFNDLLVVLAAWGPCP